MGKHPKIENLKPLFEKGEDFNLTDSQYEKKTGVQLPKYKYYLRNNSALAREASKYGYEIEVIEKKVKFRKKG